MKKPSNPKRADDQNPEWTDDDFKRAVPFSGLPKPLQARLAAIQRGRPKSEVTKERISIRLSRDVLESFRGSGAGWQTRMDAALKEWLRTQDR